MDLAFRFPLACADNVVRAEDNPTEKLSPVTLHRVVASAAEANSSDPKPATNRIEINHYRTKRIRINHIHQSNDMKRVFLRLLAGILVNTML